jgi:hypothetical protein
MAVHLHTLTVSQGQAAELTSYVVRKQVPGPVTIPLSPARSVSNAHLELTRGNVDWPRDPTAWPAEPQEIADAVFTMAAFGYVAEHLHKPNLLIGGFLFWLIRRQTQRPPG